MDEKQKKIIDGIKKLGKGNNSFAKSIIEAKVVSVQNDNLCVVEVDGLEIENVQLRAIENGDNKGLIVVPKEQSFVLIGSIEGREDFVVLHVAVAEKIICKIGGISFDILEDKIKLNGDTHGGVIVENKIVSELQKVNALLNALKQVCSVPIMEPGNGSPSAFQAVLNGALSSLQTPTYQGITNDKVKHG